MSTAAASPLTERKPKNKTVTQIEHILNYKIYRDVSILGGVALFAGGVVAVKLIAQALRDKGQKTIEDEINVSNLSYPKTQYVIYADSLEYSMQTSMTNGKDVFPVFEKMNTDDDVRQLILAFGIRTNYWFGIPMFKKGLQYWIADELRESEREDLNQILSNNGITIRF